MSTSFEPWADAYMRILKEVEAEFPDATDQQTYPIYRRRCAEWKRDRRIKLSESDVEALGKPEPAPKPSPSNDKRTGWDCDYGGCTKTKDDGVLWRVNPTGEKGIFMCDDHARETNAFENRIGEPR